MRRACDDAPTGVFFSDLEFEDDASPEYAAHVAETAHDYCEVCPFQTPCFQISLEAEKGKGEPFGIFGGVGRAERRSIIRRSKEKGLALKCRDCGAGLSPDTVRAKVPVCAGCTPIEGVA